ncbi:hypothetical protein Mapa_009756 [Marchantia paleacea]|nr:hypothetical protein Mapa_009756 [Marchantia paleacea]
MPLSPLLKVLTAMAIVAFSQAFCFRPRDARESFVVFRSFQWLQEDVLVARCGPTYPRTKKSVLQRCGLFPWSETNPRARVSSSSYESFFLKCVVRLACIAIPKACQEAMGALVEWRGDEKAT